MHIFLKLNIKSLQVDVSGVTFFLSNVSFGGYFEDALHLKHCSNGYACARRQWEVVQSHLLCGALIISIHSPACIGRCFSAALPRGNYFLQSSSA